MWEYRTPGIPDELFERAEGVPITKEEVRAVQIGKARLQEGGTVYDVGCGSGSVGIEAALQVGPRGTVTGIDHNAEAVALSRRNAERFGASNASFIHGDAVREVARLGPADAVFVGGTGGDTAPIVELCAKRLAPGGRIVVGVIQIETLYSVLQALRGGAFGPADVTQVTISKGRTTATGTMMLARNPVTVISAARA